LHMSWRARWSVHSDKVVEYMCTEELCGAMDGWYFIVAGLKHVYDVHGRGCVSEYDPTSMIHLRKS
jgi:hypothetical protein